VVCTWTRLNAIRLFGEGNCYLTHSIYIYIDLNIQPPQRKSKTTKSRRKDHPSEAICTDAVIWTDDIPVAVQTGIIDAIERCLTKHRDLGNRMDTTTTDNHKDVSQDQVGIFVQDFCEALAPYYTHPTDIGDTTTTLFDTNEIMACLHTRPAVDNIPAVSVGRSSQRHRTNHKQQNLERWAANAYRLLQKSIKVYNLLDISGKGCIVPEDIYRTMTELNITTSTGKSHTATSKTGSEPSYDDVLAMMTEFTNASSSKNTEYTLSCEDIIRIARLVHL
jgi:hypothetical protein